MLIPFRFLLLILFDELSLHNLHPAYFLLDLTQFIVLHKALLIQILQCFLPALVVDTLAAILPSFQGGACLTVFTQFILILLLKGRSLLLRQFLPCLVEAPILLPLIVSSDACAQFDRQGFVLLASAFQIVEFAVDLFHCFCTGGSIRNVILMLWSRERANR